MEYEKIKKDVQKTLSPKRYQHSLRVEKRAIALAKIYNIEIDLIRKVAIAHDIAKEMTSQQLYQYARENQIQLDEIEQQEPSIVHSKVGADICKKRYGFTLEMAQAVQYHTTGHANMTLLDKIIFVADKTEEGRTHINLQQVNAIADKDIDEGVLYVCKDSLEYMLAKQILIHPDTIQLINQIRMQQRNKQEKE